MNASICKFIKVLSDRCRSLEWNGWRRRIFPSGQFVSYQAYLHGCLIKISDYDCTGVEFHAYFRDLRWIRGLKAGNTKWIEVEVTDLMTRFGRRKLMERTIFLPSHPQYDEVLSLLDEIKSVGRMFEVANADRMSSDQALLMFCNQL